MPHAAEILRREYCKQDPSQHWEAVAFPEHYTEICGYYEKNYKISRDEIDFIYGKVFIGFVKLVKKDQVKWKPGEIKKTVKNYLYRGVRNDIVSRKVSANPFKSGRYDEASDGDRDGSASTYKEWIVEDFPLLFRSEIARRNLDKQSLMILEACYSFKPGGQKEPGFKKINVSELQRIFAEKFAGKHKKVTRKNIEKYLDLFRSIVRKIFNESKIHNPAVSLKNKTIEYNEKKVL